MEEVDKFSNEVKMLKSENALLQDELRRAKESAETQKTPPNVMGSLVDKLRNDISEKEKKIRAMGRIIADLKTELVDNAVARERKDNIDSRYVYVIFTNFAQNRPILNFFFITII